MGRNAPRKLFRLAPGFAPRYPEGVTDTPLLKADLPVMVFGDGASSGNPGPGGWGSIIVLPEGHVTELGGGDPETTNNRMELMAAIQPLRRLAERTGEIELFTDSVYVINGITKWVWGWRSKGWKTAEGKDVANADLWKILFGVVAKRGRENPVHWKFVRGHAGIPGNERCDEIAVAFSKGRRPQLYDGPLLQYGVAIHDLPEDFTVPERTQSSQKPKAPAHSYLSVVNGVPMRHSTWKECEARVKGRSGAKFKKAMSAEDEAELLRSWGYAASDLKEQA